MRTNKNNNNTKTDIKMRILKITITATILFSLLCSFTSCSPSDSDALPQEETEKITYEKSVMMIVGYDTNYERFCIEPVYEVVKAEFDAETDSFIQVLFTIMDSDYLRDSYDNIYGDRLDYFCPMTTMFIHFNRESCTLPLMINPELDASAQLEIHLNRGIFNVQHETLSTIVGDDYTREMAVNCVLDN
tara:strand:+ start:423 stop:989 length:567 start_codon:yes stop_codon:yes gene_type:complete